MKIVNSLTQHAMQKDGVLAELTPAEAALLDKISKIRFGRIERLTISNGQPVACEVATEQVRFDVAAAV